jgi:molybdate transport system substrate-binding protein
MKKITFAVPALLALTLAGCGASSDKTASTGAEKTEKTEITAFIAASLSNSMEEISSMYTKEHPDVTINYNADSSGKLKTQIEEGAKCDLFFSAANAQMNTLTDEGYTSDVKELLTNKLVLIKPVGTQTDVTSFETITNAKSIALADESVPVGAYSREVFTSLGTLDSVMSMTINECSNVTNVLTAVAEGSNEVGIVYATDAASMPDKVEIIAEAPEGTLSEPVTYPVGLIKPEDSSKETEETKKFLSYLSTDDATAVFEKNGFTVIK